MSLLGFLLTAGAFLLAANAIHELSSRSPVLPFDLPGPLVYDSCDPGGRLTRPLLADSALRLQVAGARRFREAVTAPYRSLGATGCSLGSVEVEYTGDLDAIYDDLAARIPRYGWAPAGQTSGGDPVAFTRRAAYAKSVYQLNLYELSAVEGSRPTVAIVVEIPAST